MTQQHDINILYLKKFKKPERDDPNIEYPRPDPEKVEPEQTPTLDFNYKTPY